jgi:hypothetical protein
MKTQTKVVTLAIVAALSLSACATEPLFGPTVYNFKPPVLDETKITPEQRVSFPKDLSECQTLANQSITKFEENAALYSPNEQTRVTEKRRAVRRACLQGRGYSVLY